MKKLYLNLYTTQSLRSKSSAVALACLLTLPAMAQTTETFSVPGLHNFKVPPGTGSLQVLVKGAAGGSGGWDDGPGGRGAGGSVVAATIEVFGGETVDIVVGEGGEGALGTPKSKMRSASSAYASGGAGGGDGMSQNPGAVATALPGAGGRGGDAGTKGSSPGAAGGGGASSLKVAGAAIVAGGGGGGGANTLLRIDGNWGNEAPAAQNALMLNLQALTCATAQAGTMGLDGNSYVPIPNPNPAPGANPAEDVLGNTPGNVDGGGGGGGGGGYQGQAGQGGLGAVDRIRFGSPGTSGASCTLDAGGYKISGVSIAAGNATATVTDGRKRGEAKPSGEDGSVTITAIPAPLNTVPMATPALSGTATVDQVVTANYSYADTESDPEDTSATGTQYALVRSTAVGLTAAAQGTVIQSGPSMGASAARSYTLAAADEGQYLYYCVTPAATQGVKQGAEACSSALGPVAKAPITPPVNPPGANVTPVPVLNGVGLLLASMGMGGFGAWWLRRRKVAFER
ncbi:MAG: hypothetical protein RSD57_10435 [Comamonas sp.]